MKYNQIHAISVFLYFENQDQIVTLAYKK